MRFLQALLLLLFLGVVIVFAVQNRQTVDVRFLNWGMQAPLALSYLAVYALGMLSGWTVVAFLQRSIRQMSERPRDE